MGPSPMNNGAAMPTAPAGQMPGAGNLPLAAMFLGNSGYGNGYQQTPIAPVTAPAYPTAAMTPQQAAAATMARMQARTPVAAHVAAPKPTDPWAGTRGGNGSASGRGSGGAW
jgi:hypothetical protein